MIAKPRPPRRPRRTSPRSAHAPSADPDRGGHGSPGMLLATARAIDGEEDDAQGDGHRSAHEEAGRDASLGPRGFDLRAHRVVRARAALARPAIEGRVVA